MRLTHLKTKGLHSLPDAQKRTHLAKALAFTLAMPALCLDVLGDKAAYLRTASNDGQAGVLRLDGSRLVLPGDEDMRKAFEGALRAKYATPDQTPNLTDAAQAVTSWFHDNMPELDLGWVALFDLVDLRGSNQSQFDIRTTSQGITWEQRLPGQPATIRRSPSVSKTDVAYVEYAAGLGILDVWLQFNQFWNVMEAVAEFMANAADKRAEIHYGLLTAQSSGIDVAFATDDQTTFNAAAADILRDLRTAGMAVGANAQFDIVCAPEKVGRILAMLDAKRGSPMIAFGTSSQPIAFGVRNVISTTHVTAADTGYYLVLPNRKMKRGVWKDMTLESKRDIAASATDWVGTEQYNAAIAETNQVRRVKYA